MGIWSRLGSVINSYVNDMIGEGSRESSFQGRANLSGDPDFDEAYDELNDFLNGKEKRNGEKEQAGYAWKDRSFAGGKLPPEELRADFECLGVPFGADGETCKAAYKKLLKIHHPDRHAGHEGNFKKATERSAKINAAWDRIEKLWIQR
jgi:curved DNA-binding protein CbpA